MKPKKTGNPTPSRIPFAVQISFTLKVPLLTEDTDGSKSDKNLPDYTNSIKKQKPSSHHSKREGCKDKHWLNTDITE